jgi:hypothetical protein
MDHLRSMISPPPSPPGPFVVTLARDDEARVWIAVCDSIPFSTQADPLARLLARVSEIAPGNAVLNGLAAEERDVRPHLVLDVNRAAQAS